MWLRGHRGTGVGPIVDEGQDGAILSVRVVFGDREVFGKPDGITPAFVADLVEAVSLLSFVAVLSSFGSALSIQPGLGSLVCGALVNGPLGIATEP